MRRLGLERHIQIATGEFTDEGGYLGAQRLLDGQERPTAIFVANDLAAMGVLTAVREAGLSSGRHLPRRLRQFLPGPAQQRLSTSIDQPRHEMGILAARLLLERVGSERTETRREVLKPSLVPRSTSAPPR